MTALRQSLILSLLLLLVTTGAALAQVLEVGGGFGVNRVSNAILIEDTSTSPSTVVAQVNNGWRMGFRMTINTQPHFGHEAGYSYVRTNLDFQGTTYGTAAHQGFYDFLVYATPEGKKVRPFVAGGAQFTNFIPPGGSVSQGSGVMKFGVNFGGGVKVKVTDKWLMRVDFRQYLSPKPDFNYGVPTPAPQGWIRMNEISMGVAYCL